MTVDELADLLHVNRDSAYKAVAAGEVPVSSGSVAPSASVAPCATMARRSRPRPALNRETKTMSVRRRRYRDPRSARYERFGCGRRFQTSGRPQGADP